MDGTNTEHVDCVVVIPIKGHSSEKKIYGGIGGYGRWVIHNAGSYRTTPELRRAELEKVYGCATRRVKEP